MIKKITVIALIVFATKLHAQTDMDLLNEPAAKTHDVVKATFKGTRVVNFHTNETPGKRELEFRISHRFGTINSGSYNAWGVDGSASIRLGLEYSYNGRLAFGIGRTSTEKMLDGFVKYKLLRQTKDNYMPISVTLLGGIYSARVRDTKYDEYGLAGRTSYCTQIIVARKFSDKLSIIVAPTYLHFNLVDSLIDKNDGVVLALIGRYKINKRTAITAEYGYRLIKNHGSKIYHDSFALGIDIDTGGHIFQMHLTNSFGIVENQFLAKTKDSWKSFGIRLGFNVSRMFFI